MVAKKKTTKSTTKKVVSKKSPSRNLSTKKSNGIISNDLSFKSIKDPIPFMTTKFTQQTLIWTVLLVFIMLIQIWILNVQLTTAETLNSIK